ncbi:MAG: hypothetical protein Q8O97_02505 [bacterium]|nr:hypothetical protein [Candidatus Wildermuthbacteria bacterium]MDP2664807.1 hypothetical protein [bacterium]
MAVRETKIAHNVTPEELQAEIVRILLTARVVRQRGVFIGDIRDLLDPGSAAAVRILASSQEISQAAEALAQTGAVLIDRVDRDMMLRLPK